MKWKFIVFEKRQKAYGSRARARKSQSIEVNIRDRSFFMREGGLVGFGKHHLKIA